MCLAALCGITPGCKPIIWEQEDKQRAEMGVDVQVSSLADSAAYRDTIGALTY